MSFFTREQEIKTILNANNILYNYDVASPELVQETGLILLFINQMVL